MNSFSIRPESEPDFDVIDAVVAAAFESSAEAQLVRRIRSSVHYRPDLSFVVVDGDGEVVGHVMVSGAILVAGARRHEIVMLSPLAVTPEHRRRGIGSALVRVAVEAADRASEPLVVLEGSPRFYSRLGFEPAHRHGIELPLPDWAPIEAGQVFRLREYRPSLRGAVAYPSAFDIVAEPTNGTD